MELEFGEYGFPDDGYDYSKHFINLQSGVFIPATTEKKSKENNLKTMGYKEAEEAVKIDFEDDTFVDDQEIERDDLKEVDRFFEMENDEEIGNDLQDDFVMQAMGGELGSFGGFEGDDEEDYEFDENDIPPMLLGLFKKGGMNNFEGEG